MRQNLHLTLEAPSHAIVFSSQTFPIIPATDHLIKINLDKHSLVAKL